MVKPLDLVLGQHRWRSRLGFSLQSEKFGELLPGCSHTSSRDKRHGQKSSYCNRRKRAPARSLSLQRTAGGVGPRSLAERAAIGGRLEAGGFGGAQAAR